MADQNFMDLASKTASGIAGTDYMMLVNNSEAYKALVNDVAEAILGKLTSKSFSGLDTTAKNVIGALNELNSKSAIILNSDSATQMSFACKQGAKYFIIAQTTGSQGDNGIGPAVLTIAPNYRMDNLKVVTIFQNNNITPDITISNNVITMRFKTGDKYMNFIKALIFKF